MKRTAEITPTSTPSKIMPWAEPIERTPEKVRGPPLVLKASPTKQIVRRNIRSDAIKTYVFFDLECTGLFPKSDKRDWARVSETSDEYREQLENKCIHTRRDEFPFITEMSFCAISRETFDELKQERMEIVKWNEEHPDRKKQLATFIPTNTHTRQLNPGMTMNQWKKYEDNRKGREDKLVHVRRMAERNNTFDKEWPSVIDFLDSLQKPALLIGHNCLEYDLRVIYGEIVRSQLLANFGIPKDIFFMDSLLMAKYVDMNLEKELTTVCKYIKFPKIPTKEDDEFVIQDSLDSTIQQDIPPIREPTIVNGVPVSDHPVNFLDWDQFPVALRKRIRNESFSRTPSGGWTYRKSENNRYGLEVLYQELVGGEYNAHFAQPDAEALMQVCLSYGDEFSKFGDTFAAAIPF